MQDAQPEYLSGRRAPASAARQEQLLRMVDHPLLRHSAFDEATAFAGKLDEMLTLRRGAQSGRPRPGRPRLPLLYLSRLEERRLTDQLKSLAYDLRQALQVTAYQPAQLRLKQLLAERAELRATRALTEGLTREEATRWKNFITGLRGPLPADDAGIVTHIRSQLLDLLSLLEVTVNFR